MITTEERPAEVEEKTDTLRISDRCDSCGSQAYVGLVFEENKDLLMCAHHFAKWEPKLRESSIQIFDERWKLSSQRQGV